MANVRYAVYSSMTSEGKFAYKIYKVDFLGKGTTSSGKTEVMVIEPVVGAYFSFRKGKSFLISPSNIFDNKRQAIVAAIKMMKNLKTTYSSYLSNKPKRMLDYIFENGDLSVIDFEKLYEKFRRELKNG